MGVNCYYRFVIYYRCYYICCFPAYAGKGNQLLHGSMVTGRSAACAVMIAIVGMGMLHTLCMKMVVLVGMCVVMLMGMVVGMAVGNTVVGVLMGVGMGMLVAVANVIVMDVHSVSP